MRGEDGAGPEKAEPIVAVADLRERVRAPVFVDVERFCLWLAQVENERAVIWLWAKAFAKSSANASIRRYGSISIDSEPNDECHSIAAVSAG